MAFESHKEIMDIVFVFVLFMTTNFGMLNIAELFVWLKMVIGKLKNFKTCKNN